MGACDCIITKVYLLTVLDSYNVAPFEDFVLFLILLLFCCLVPQAGPGTIAEALIRGLPIILNDFIPGQVCAYYLSAVMDLYCHNEQCKSMSSCIYDLLKKGSTLRNLSESVLLQACMDATLF